jgi:hypothetical protein
MGDDMANDDHINILKEGPNEWNQWREENPDVKPDLSRADFTYANLISTNLSDVNLREADLMGVNLIGANLKNAKLYHANLIRADLRGADLSEANLIWAHLNRANLRSAILNKTQFQFAEIDGTSLSGAELDGAIFGWTKIGDIDLSEVKGLDTVRHEGPSTIGINTIYRSKGEIPEIFLLGAGVPDIFIAYVTSLTGKAFEFYSCFISYSSGDEDFAERLYNDLQGKGVRCWFAPEDLRIGDRIRVGIDESIRKHDKLLLVLSRHSVESDWIEKEVETALEQERIQKRIILFPIRLDDSVIKSESGWPADIRRSRNIGNFKQWKDHDLYRKALNKLMRDLKADTPGQRRV